MSKPPQDVFHLPDETIVKPLTPRIEVALTVPDGVDIAITINGIGVLLGSDEEDEVDPDANRP